MLLMRFSSLSVPLTQRLVTFRRNVTGFSSSSNKHPRNFYSCKKSIGQNGITCSTFDNLPSTSASKDSPLSGVEDVLMCYIYGKKKATEVAHLVWKHVVQKGDTVVDATCGNGYDTLAMLKMVADESGMGRVYGMDIQKDAVEITSSLLGESLNPYEKELVKLFAICHSRMEEVVPKDTSVRLVAFNLGYLPGGDKAITTKSGTTLLALEAAKRILVPGGLISIVVYVGHPGGREEFETVLAFASGLSVENWICCKFQMLNRPLAPLALQFVIVDFIDRNHINLDAEGNEENMLNTELAMGSNSVSMFCTRWLVQVSSAHLDI